MVSERVFAYKPHAPTIRLCGCVRITLSHKRLKLYARLLVLRRTFETLRPRKIRCRTVFGGGLICGLFRDRVQFCSALVDLVVGVRHHRGGGHRLTLAGERFVCLFAENIA
jgi:hypothetical protein